MAKTTRAQREKTKAWRARYSAAPGAKSTRKHDIPYGSGGRKHAASILRGARKANSISTLRKKGIVGKDMKKALKWRNTFASSALSARGY